MPKRQHPVPKEMLILIGDMTVSYALLELTIQRLAGSLIYDHQRICQIVLCDNSFGQLLGVTRSLYIARHGQDQDFEKLSRLLKEAEQCHERRNAITHSIWGAGPNAESATRIKDTAKKKNGFDIAFEHLDVADLSDFVEKIKILSGEIEEFWLDLMKANNSPAAGVPSSTF